MSKFPTYELCTICKNKATGRNCSHPAAACCGQIKRVHKSCAKEFFKVTNPDAQIVFDTWLKGRNCNLLCSECQVPCFFCTTQKVTHHFRNENVKVIKCPTQNCTSW